MDLLIENIDTITAVDGNMFIKQANIGISGQKIDFVTGDGSVPEGFKPDRIIDGTHKLAMPGLVNAHTHCAMTLLRNYADDIALEDWLYKYIFPAEEELTPEDIYWGSMLGIAEMLLSGVTTFADMYLHMDEVARAVIDSGIRANLSKSPYQFDICGIVNMDDSAACYDYYRKWNGMAEGRLKVYVEVHSAYLFNEETLSCAAQLAKQCGTGIHIHILETIREREESIQRYGLDSAEICSKCGIFDVPVIAAHCVHLSDNDITILKEKGVNIVHNPTSNLKLGSGIARIPDLLETGINIALGTDGAASNNNLNMFEEMHLSAILHKGVGMNPQLIGATDVIKMATTGGAKAVGFGKEAGAIAPGMSADIILIDTDKPHFYPLNNPLASIVYTAQASDVDTVLVDGNIIVEKREFKSIDIEKIKSEVNRFSLLKKQ